jgi:hypothetical protein
MCGSVLSLPPRPSHGEVSYVEAMGKARHDRFRAGRNFPPWESMSSKYREKMMREAAADLFALADMLRPLLW